MTAETRTGLRRWWSRIDTRWIILVLVLARVAALVYLLVSHQERIDGGLAGDVKRYVEMANAHGLPYQDFQVEYPPVTLGLIRLLASPDLARSIILVVLSQFACDLGIAGLLRWAWGRRALLAYLAIGLPLMAFPFVYARIDLFTALLAVAGMALIRRRQELPGGAMLAVAALAKVWPFVLAPILLIERKVKALAAYVAVSAVLVGGWWRISGAAGIQQVLSFRDAAGWQVESLFGNLWHLRDPSRIKFESGAFRTGVMPGWARPTLTFISVAFIVLGWWLAARRRKAGSDDTVVFGSAPLVGVLALLIFAPILSPQYVVWMLPFAAIVAARGDRVAGLLSFAICAVTTLTYVWVPAAAGGVLYGILSVTIRNLLLVALFVVSLQGLAGVRRREITDTAAMPDAPDEAPATDAPAVATARGTRASASA